ncbi:MAG: EamA family transporter [Thermoleophilia bacterium]|nr:EamA family transporter [Thermoleophilia bacterium]
MATRSTSRPLLVTALLVTWIAWGSSFVAISWALESLPPLLLMASRFIAAGTIALAVGMLRARRDHGAVGATLQAWRDASIVGAGFIVVGMGATSWAATRLPAGVTALLVATAPLWIVLLQLVLSRGRSFNRLAMAGVAAGTAGVGLLVAPGGSSGSSVDLAAAAVLVLANGVWAAASLFARRASRPSSLLVGVGMQMLAGGVLLAIASALAGELAGFDPRAITALAGGSWVFLVVAASLGGFVAYGWLLEHASATTASTHAFVNPLVAVALGAVLLDEAIDREMLGAGAAIVLAVVLLMLGEARVPAATSVSAGQPMGRRRRRTRFAAGVAARPASLGRITGGRRLGWTPAPTPSFAARRQSSSPRGSDPMDPLAIDEALDGFGS